MIPSELNLPNETKPSLTSSPLLCSLPVLLPVPTLLLQAYLMFTPGASRLLRLALLPFTVASIIPIGFSHHFYGENQYSDLNNLAGLCKYNTPSSFYTELSL